MSARSSASRVPAHCRRAARVVLPCCAPACAWFTDFKQQPKIDPWESARTPIAVARQPADVGADLRDRRAGLRRVARALPATIDSMAAIANPIAADSRVAAERPEVLPDQLRRLPRHGGQGRWTRDRSTACSRGIRSSAGVAAAGAPTATSSA